MTFSNYHLYVERIRHIDQVVGAIAALAIIELECLFLVRLIHPSWVKPATWLLIGVFYATLFILVNAGVGGS